MKYYFKTSELPNFHGSFIFPGKLQKEFPLMLLLMRQSC